jgi:hypothetical protein
MLTSISYLQYRAVKIAEEHDNELVFSKLPSGIRFFLASKGRVKHVLVFLYQLRYALSAVMSHHNVFSEYNTDNGYRFPRRTFINF